MRLLVFASQSHASSQSHAGGDSQALYLCTAYVPFALCHCRCGQAASGSVKELEAQKLEAVSDLTPVQFARIGESGYDQQAIKFFLRLSDFECEQRLYLNQPICHVLPPLQLASDNAAQSFVSQSGWPFPPFLIVERGTTLQECASLLMLMSCHSHARHLHVSCMQRRRSFCIDLDRCRDE